VVSSQPASILSLPALELDTSAINTFSELLQPGRHRLIRLVAALLASAPSALVLAPPHSPHSLHLLLMRGAGRCRPPALLVSAPDALVLADARPPALLAFAPLALVRAHTARLLLHAPPPY